MHNLNTTSTKAKTIQTALFATLTGRWIEGAIAVAATLFALSVFSMVALAALNLSLPALSMIAGPAGLSALLLVGLHGARSWAVGEHKLLLIDAAMIAAVIALAHLALRSAR